MRTVATVNSAMVQCACGRALASSGRGEAEDVSFFESHMDMPTQESRDVGMTDWVFNFHRGPSRKIHVASAGAPKRESPNEASLPRFRQWRVGVAHPT